MNSEPKNIDILQNLEFAVVEVYRKHREMSDHVAARAYEAAFERYRAEARGHQPKPSALTGLDLEVFDALVGMCEFRLGRTTMNSVEDEAIPPIPVDEIVDCLRELRKSVERHTRIEGRQGYLTFVSSFLK
jgi:hypothetical protein